MKTYEEAVKFAADMAHAMRTSDDENIYAFVMAACEHTIEFIFDKAPTDEELSPVGDDIRRVMDEQEREQ